MSLYKIQMVLLRVACALIAVVSTIQTAALSISKRQTVDDGPYVIVPPAPNIESLRKIGHHPCELILQGYEQQFVDFEVNPFNPAYNLLLSQRSPADEAASIQLRRILCQNWRRTTPAFTGYVSQQVPLEVGEVIDQKK